MELICWELILSQVDLVGVDLVELICWELILSQVDLVGVDLVELFCWELILWELISREDTGGPSFHLPINTGVFPSVSTRGSASSTYIYII